MIIGFLHCFTENIGLKSMLNMDIFTTEGIHLYCNQKKFPILKNVRVGPGMSGTDRACPGRAGSSLGVAGRGSLISPGVAGRGSATPRDPANPGDATDPKIKTHPPSWTGTGAAAIGAESRAGRQPGAGQQITGTPGQPLASQTVKHSRRV